MKRKTLLMVVLVIVLISAIFSVISMDVKALERGRHKDISKQIGDDFGFSKDTTEEYSRANVDQDDWSVLHLIGGYKDSRSNQPQYHCDRHYWWDENQRKYVPDDQKAHQDAFDACRKYIKEEKDKFIDNLSNAKDEKDPLVKEAIDALGRMSHALQDFYSHSNYLDLPDDLKKEAQEALEDPTKPLSDKLKASLKITGWQKNEPLGGDPKNDPLNFHHKGNNKDYSDSAKNAAYEHTKNYLNKLKDVKNWDYLKKWKRPTPPPDSEKTWKIEPVKSYIGNISLNVTSYCALNLTIIEVLPPGVSFLDSIPPPIFVDKAFEYVSPSYPNETVTLIAWRFLAEEPVGLVKIEFRVHIDEPALSYPVVALRGIEPKSGYFDMAGEAIEVDINGTVWECFLHDQYIPSPSPPSPPPGVGGYVIPVDKFALLVPYIGLASTILVATVATAVYVKRVKHKKERQQYGEKGKHPEGESPLLLKGK